MSSISNNTNNTQSKVWINGQYLPATQDKASGDWYVVVDGKRVKVDKNDLFGMNSDITEVPQYMVNYWDKMLAENEEKRNFLKEVGEYLQKQIKSAKQEYDGYLASIGVKEMSDITNKGQIKKAKKYYTSLTELGSDKRRNTAEFLSACTDGVDYALKLGDWKNQLNLAETIQNSLNGFV